MGDTVKAIAGLALAYFAPVLAGLTTNIWAYGAVLVGATLVGASVAGSALAPDVGDIGGTDSYAGQKLQTQKSNTSPVPVVYGFHRIAGNIIYQTTRNLLNGDTSAKGYNRDYYSVIVLAGHACNSNGLILDDLKVFSGETEMTFGNSNRFSTANVFVKYSYNSSAINIRDLTWNTSGGDRTGSSSDLNLDSVVIPANCTFLLVHQVFDGEDSQNTQLENITVEIKGKEIRTITDSSTISTLGSYSTNPVEIVIDLLTNALSIPDADIDIASFYQAKTDCNNNSWTCNIALIQQANIQSIIQDVLATCRGSIVHSGNKWKLKIDTKSQTSVKTLDDDDFINNSLSISMRGNGEIANKMILKYVNPSDNWLAAQVEKEDTTLQNWDGQTIEKVLDVKGITNATQANELAEITLNSMRYSEDVNGNRVKQTPLVLSFATTVKNADLEVGDVITVDSDLLDRNRKFMILSVETDQSGLIQLSTREYCETHYKDSSGTYLI
ncbi:MAG: phage tail protein [Candidatus Thioglobus sp.]